ncbi:hypothetical protein V6Z11_D06G041100 [Gossypium hirsutum]
MKVSAPFTSLPHLNYSHPCKLTDFSSANTACRSILFALVVAKKLIVSLELPV